MNYDKIISNTLVNHAAMGYLNRNEGYGCVNQDFVDQFPQIGGVAGHNVPPQISLDGYSSMGCNAGVNLGNVTTRPTFIANDAVTWTKGAHTIKFGMEWRKVMGNIHQNGNEAGSFSFGDGATGISGINSGNGFASFLLGAADSASVAYRSVPSNFARQHAWIVHAGDSWRVNNKLTLDYGLRWDYYSPSSEGTTACRSSIRPAPTLALGGGQVVWRSPATAMVPRATAHRIRRRTGTAVSHRV